MRASRRGAGAFRISVSVGLQSNDVIGHLGGSVERLPDAEDLHQRADQAEPRLPDRGRGGADLRCPPARDEIASALGGAEEVEALALHEVVAVAALPLRRPPPHASGGDAEDARLDVELDFGVLPAAGQGGDAVAEVGGDVADADEAVAVGVAAERLEERLGEGTVLPVGVLERVLAGGGGGKNAHVRGSE